MPPQPHSPPAPPSVPAPHLHQARMTTVFVHEGRGITEETALDESPSNARPLRPPPTSPAPAAVPSIPFARALGRDMLDPVCCALSASGATLHVAARMHSLWLHGVGGADEARTRATGDVVPSARSCALSGDGETAAFAGAFGLEVMRRGGGTLLAIDHDGAPIAPLAPYSVALSADASVVALSMLHATGPSGRISVLRTADCSVLASWDVRLNLNQGTVALSAAGHVVAHAFVGGAQIVEVKNGRLGKQWMANGALDVALDATGAVVAIADERRLRVRGAWNSARDVDVLGYVPPNFDPYVAISADGGIVVASVQGHRFALFCAKTGVMRAMLIGQDAPVTGLAISGDAGVVLACAAENQVHLWNISEGVKSGNVQLQLGSGESGNKEHGIGDRKQDGIADGSRGDEIEKVVDG